eukprot:856777-Prymnesium_polylepis.1
MHNGGLIRRSWRDESRFRALRQRGRHAGWVVYLCRNWPPPRITRNPPTAPLARGCHVPSWTL